MRSAPSRSFRRAAIATTVGLLVVGAATAAQIDAPAARAAGPTVACATDPAILNTGYDGAGGRLLTGTDRGWEVGEGTDASSASSVSTWSPATIVTNPDSLWITSPYNNASWIAHSSTGAHSGHKFFYFRYQFVLDPAVQPDAFSVGMDFFADNSVMEIWINGAPQSADLPAIPQTTVDPQDYGGFLPGRGASAILDRGWVSGQNEIIVMVESGGPNSGFLAQTTSTGYCADYGDAPVSYGTAKADGGAVHLLASTSSPLTLGASVDIERDASGFDGRGDDVTGTDDEDGVSRFAPLTTFTTQYRLPVMVRNATGAPATLAGWIDVNRDGQFSAAERSLVAVAPGATSVALDWSGLTAQEGATYARLRLLPGTVTDPQPVGAVVGGEVEDYPLTVERTLAATGGGIDPAVPASALVLLLAGALSRINPLRHVGGRS